MPIFSDASAFTVDSSTFNDVKGCLYNNTFNISTLSVVCGTQATPLDDNPLGYLDENIGSTEAPPLRIAGSARTSPVSASTALALIQAGSPKHDNVTKSQAERGFEKESVTMEDEVKNWPVLKDPEAGVTPSHSFTPRRSWQNKIGGSIKRLGSERQDTNKFSEPFDVSIDVEDLSEDEVIIAVMGPTGVGKSSFIAAATGQDVRVGHDLQSCTNEITMVKCTNLNVVFVDTPGFDDTNKSDTEILEQLAWWLDKTYRRKITLAGILYFHRITDNRMAGTPLKNLQTFRALCGRDAMGKVVLVTTMWDDVSENMGNCRETELKMKYWKQMIELGSMTARYQGTRASAWEVVGHIVQVENLRCFGLLPGGGPSGEGRALLLQREMVDGQMSLPETSAGWALYTKLDATIKEDQKLLKAIREVEKRGEKMGPEELARLKSQGDCLRKQLFLAMGEMQMLQLPLSKRLVRQAISPLMRS